MQNTSAQHQSSASQRNNSSRNTSVTQAGAQRGQAFRPSGMAGNKTIPHTPAPDRPHTSGAAGRTPSQGAPTPDRNSSSTLHPPIPRSQQAPAAANTGAAGKTPQGESSVHRPARFSAVPPNMQSSGVISDSRIQQGGTNVNSQAQTNIKTGPSSVRQNSHNTDGRGTAATRGADNAATRSANPHSSAATPGVAGTETRRMAAAPDKPLASRQSVVAPSPNAESRVQSTTPGTGRDRPATAAGAQVQGGSRQARQESGPYKPDSNRILQRPTPGIAGKATQPQHRPTAAPQGVINRNPIDNTPKRAKGAKQTRKNRKGGKT